MLRGVIGGAGMWLKDGEIGGEGKEENKDLFGDSSGEVHEEDGDTDTDRKDVEKDCLLVLACMF